MIVGVSLIIERVDGKIVIIQETEATPWKKPGDFSIPMETQRDNETLEETIARAIEEEAKGLTEYKIIEEIGNYDVLGLALAKCFLVRVKKFKNPLTGIEVRNHQWLLPEEALGLKLRPGAKEMIGDYISSHSK